MLECYDQKRLIVAIPLTCRVLQEACNSKIFKPPNPWLMGILKLLAELYWQENLSLKLKFEIEILYKALELDLNGKQWIVPFIFRFLLTNDAL